MALPEHVYVLSKRVTTVGRHPNNDISLLLESVSRFHAKLEERDGIYTLFDLNSSNGTFLNGERLAGPRSVREKDVITFGRADFTFSFFSPEERKQQGEESSGRIVSTPSGSTVSIVADDDASSSTILSTQLNIESTPYPEAEVRTEKRVDLKSLKKSNERLLTLYKLSEVIRMSATREEVLSNVMDLIFDVLPADRGVIMISYPGDSELQPEIVRFRDPINSSGLTISKTILNKCISERVAVLSRDAKIDTRFTSSDSIMASDIRSAMCIPLVSKSSMIGVLFIDTNESVRAFTEEDLAFASSFACDLAMTLDNINLAQENIKNERLAAVGQTIAGLAHNIKNILQLAKGGIELMDAAISRKAYNEVESFWPVVRRGIDRMQNLTQEMLDFSRQTSPTLVEMNVNKVVEETVEMFHREHVDAGVDIDLQLAPSLPLRKVDRDGICKALMNLISNSMDALEGGGGLILISTHSQGDTVFLTVEDNGKGVPKDKIGRIFQPFFTTKGSKGTGLGLSMTRKYIEDMGGQISVQSEEGRGTRFTIALMPLTSHFGVDIDGEASSSTQRG